MSEPLYEIVRHWNLSHDPHRDGVIIKRGLTVGEARLWFDTRPDDGMFYVYRREGSEWVGVSPNQNVDI